MWIYEFLGFITFQLYWNMLNNAWHAEHCKRIAHTCGVGCQRIFALLSANLTCPGWLISRGHTDLEIFLVGCSTLVSLNLSGISRQGTAF